MVGTRDTDELVHTQTLPPTNLDSGDNTSTKVLMTPRVYPISVEPVDIIKVGKRFGILIPEQETFKKKIISNIHQLCVIKNPIDKF